MRRYTWLSLVVALGVVNNQVSAQTIGGSVRGLGVNDALTALSAGYEAGLYNPAKLAKSPFSLVLGGVRAEAGLSPISLLEFSSYGERLEASEKAELLDLIQQHGGEAINVAAGVHLLGLSVKNIAINIFSSANLEGNLPPGAAELLLYGNVGRTGVGETFTFEEASARGYAITQAALSYGREFSLPFLGPTALGLTTRYGQIHGLADVRDEGSSLVNDPLGIEIEGSMVMAQNGTLYGFDLGLAWSRKNWTIGLVAHDVVGRQTLRKDEIEVKIVQGHATIEEGAADTTYTWKYTDLSEGARKNVDGRLSESLASTQIAASVAGKLGIVTPFAHGIFDLSGRDARTPEFTFGALLLPASFLEFRGAATYGEELNSVAGGISLRLWILTLELSGRRLYAPYDGWGAGVQVRFGRW